MKNILIIHHTSEVSGSENSLIDLLYMNKKNKNSNYTISVMCPDKGKLCKRFIEYDMQFIPIPLLRIKREFNLMILLSYAYQIIYIYFVLRRIIIKKNIDLLHANSTSAFIQCVLAAKLCRIPVIWHVRDMLKFSIIERVLEKFADRIITISNSTAATLFKPDDKKVSTIYNGVLIKRKNKILNNNTQLYFGSDYIIMIAQIVPWKNHKLAIEAMRILHKYYPDLKLVIVGEDLFCEHSDYVDELKKSVIRLGLSENIFFIGYQDDVTEIIRKCIILIHPAENEPLGRVVIEAMLMGKPVIAADSGGIPEYVKDGENGFLFKAGNIDDLVRKIKVVLNSTECEIIKRNAVRTARHYFDAERQSNLVMSIYDELLA